jgi:hypothetical protein
VQEVTNDASDPLAVRDAPDVPARQPLIAGDLGVDSADSVPLLSPSAGAEQDALEHVVTSASRDAEDDVPIDSLSLLRNAATALETIAARAKDLPIGGPTTLVLDRAERALTQARSVLTRLALAQTEITSTHYQLVDTDLHDILVRLLGHRPILVTLRLGQSPNTAVKVVMFVMPCTDANMKMSQTPLSDLFIAVGGAGHGVVPLIMGIPMERVRNSLGLFPEAAAAMAALINDLARVQVGLQ